MALSKTGYASVKTGRTSEKVPLNEQGFIAQDGEEVAGVKNFSISNANADNVLTANHNVINAFLAFAGGYGDEYTNKFTVTWEAE